MFQRLLTSPTGKLSLRGHALIPHRPSPGLKWAHRTIQENLAQGSQPCKPASCLPHGKHGCERLSSKRQLSWVPGGRKQLPRRRGRRTHFRQREYYVQKHGSVRVSLGNQTFIEPRLMHLSVCTARYSFIHLLIYQIVTKNLTLGPLGGKKQRCPCLRERSLLGDYRTTAKPLMRAPRH